MHNKPLKRRNLQEKMAEQQQEQERGEQQQQQQEEEKGKQKEQKEQQSKEIEVADKELARGMDLFLQRGMLPTNWSEYPLEEDDVPLSTATLEHFRSAEPERPSFRPPRRSLWEDIDRAQVPELLSSRVERTLNHRVSLRVWGAWADKKLDDAWKMITLLKAKVGKQEEELQMLKSNRDMRAEYRAYHEAMRMAASPSPSCLYLEPVAYSSADGLVKNPDHPYWRGLKFGQWLLRSGCLNDPADEWFGADQDPHHPLSLLHPHSVTTVRSWFAGIADGLARHNPKQLQSTEHIMPLPQRKTYILQETDNLGLVIGSSIRF